MLSGLNFLHIFATRSYVREYKKAEIKISLFITLLHFSKINSYMVTTTVFTLKIPAAT